VTESLNSLRSTHQQQRERVQALYDRAVKRARDRVSLLQESMRAELEALAATQQTETIQLQERLYSDEPEGTPTRYCASCGLPMALVTREHLDLLFKYAPRFGGTSYDVRAIRAAKSRKSCCSQCRAGEGHGPMCLRAAHVHDLKSRGMQ
jgi:hypothetical protein